MADDDSPETRQQRRARKLLSRRQRLKKHGAGLAQVYRNAVLGRLSASKRRKRR